MSSHMVVHTSFHLCSAWQAGRPTPERTGFKIVSCNDGKVRPQSVHKQEWMKEGTDELHRDAEPSWRPSLARSGNQRCDRPPALRNVIPSLLISFRLFLSQLGRPVPRVLHHSLAHLLSSILSSAGRRSEGGTHRIQNRFLRDGGQATELHRSRNTSGKAQNSCIEA